MSIFCVYCESASKGVYCFSGLIPSLLLWCGLSADSQLLSSAHCGDCTHGVFLLSSMVILPVVPVKLF